MSRNGKQDTETTDLSIPNCPQAIHAAAWATGELDPAAQQTYQQHLAHCPTCPNEMVAFQKTVAQLHAARMPDIEPSADLTDRILAALPPDAFRVTPFTRVLAFVRRHRYSLAAAAAAVLIAGLGAAVHISWHMPMDTQLATDAGCAWISRQQETDGSWNPIKSGGSALYRPALTALASLALMREPAHYSKAIASACSALQRIQNPDGAFGEAPSGRMYNHALATWALLAAYDKGHQPELKTTLDKAVAFIRTQQQATGGWGYGDSTDDPANTAVTAWQVQVLDRAQQAGWDDAGGHLRKGLNWLRQRADSHGGFDYTATSDDATTTPTLDAMGAYTLLTAGGSRPELIQVATAAMNHLRSTPQPNHSQTTDFYRAFFTVAAWDATGDRHRADQVRNRIFHQRETRGVDQGSWAPSDSWGKVGGRLYATSLAVLTLQSQQAPQPSRN